jgi:alpha-tubulin suppressor-like RCC1 family protein
MSSTKYYLIVSNKVQSAKGIYISESSFNFTTGDYTSPTVAIISPNNGAQNVNVSTIINVQFSESVTNVTNNLTLHQGSVNGAIVPTSLSNSINNTYQLTPLSILNPVTNYYVVAESAITDLSNNHLVTKSFNFTTLDNRVTQVVSAAQYACGIKQGKGYCWGKNGSGELGNGNTNDSNVPTAIATGGDSAISESSILVSISAGSAYDAAGASCAVDYSGEAYCWGDGQAGNIGNGEFNLTSPYPIKVIKGESSEIPLNAKLIKIGTNNNSTCAIDANGNAYCWGDNTQGQLGIGNTNNSAYAKKVATGGSSDIPVGDKLVDISVGSLYTCAVDEHGKAFCWGWNTEGQCGSGSFIDSSYPVAVATNQTNNSSQLSANAVLKQISASANTPCPTNQINTCAVDESGIGYCWGNNENGQLGINNVQSNSSVPLQVLMGVAPSAIPISAKFTKIVAGSGATCAIADYKGYCWGYNANGELGTGDTNNTAYPVALSTNGAIKANTTLTDISVGDYGSSGIVNIGLGCAVDNAYNFYCWGSNDYGQLGNGNNAQSLVPVLVNMP